MDEEATALDTELRRLYDEALTAISTLKSLGAPGTKSEASELNKDIGVTCKELRRHLRDLEQLAEEQDTADASLQVEQLVRQHKLAYEQLKSEQELAIMEMKKKSELAWRKQRQELLAGGLSRAQIKDDRTAIAASEGITESLRRTRQLMTEQIGATDANTQLIGSSTSVLGKTTQTLESQRGLFASSRSLLATMSWIVLYGGVGFFILVVIYILQKRMLGLTPQIVKTTVTNVIGHSIGTATDYYRRYIGHDKFDPVKTLGPQFDDLDESGQEFIKAVNEERYDEAPIVDIAGNDRSFTSEKGREDDAASVKEPGRVSGDGWSDISSSMKKIASEERQSVGTGDSMAESIDAPAHEDPNLASLGEESGSKQPHSIQNGNLPDPESKEEALIDTKDAQHTAKAIQAEKPKPPEEVEVDAPSQVIHKEASGHSQGDYQDIASLASDTIVKETDSIASDDSHLVIPDKHSIKDAADEGQQDYEHYEDDPYEDVESITDEIPIQSSKDEL